MKRSTSLTLALFCFIGMASHGLVWKKYQSAAKIDFCLRQQSFTKSSESGCSFLLLVCFLVSLLCVPNNNKTKQKRDGKVTCQSTRWYLTETVCQCVPSNREFWSLFWKLSHVVSYSDSYIYQWMLLLTSLEWVGHGANIVISGPWYLLYFNKSKSTIWSRSQIGTFLN